MPTVYPKYIINTYYPKEFLTFYSTSFHDDQILLNIEGKIEGRYAVLNINKYALDYHAMLCWKGRIYSIDNMFGIQLNPKDMLLREIGVKNEK